MFLSNDIFIQIYSSTLPLWYIIQLFFLIASKYILIILLKLLKTRLFHFLFLILLSLLDMIFIKPTIQQYRINEARINALNNNIQELKIKVRVKSRKIKLYKKLYMRAARNARGKYYILYL